MDIVQVYLGPIKTICGRDGCVGKVHQLLHRLKDVAHAAHEDTPLIPINYFLVSTSGGQIFDIDHRPQYRYTHLLVDRHFFNTYWILRVGQFDYFHTWNRVEV